MPKITALSQLTTPAPDDLVPIVDTSAGTTKKIALSDLTGYPSIGWIAVVDTWAFSSWDSGNATGVITVPTDATLKYSAGMKVQITQATGGTKFGFITKVTATTLTIYFGTDYTLINQTISSPMFSTERAPFAFPLDPTKWTQTFNYSDDNNVTTIAQVGAHQLSIPIGSFYLSMTATLRISNSGVNGTTIQCGLSTLNNSFDDTDFTGMLWNGSVASFGSFDSTHVYIRKPVTVTTPTIYYQVAQRGGAALTTSVLGGSGIPGKLEAVCAYI